MNQYTRIGASVCLWLGLALPALAQDAPAEPEAAPADTASAPAADAPVAEAVEAAPEAAAAEASADASVDTSAEATAETVAMDQGGDEAADDSGADMGDGEGLNLYVGAEFDSTTIDLDDDGLEAGFGGRRFDSDFAKLRLGVRLFEAVGLEIQGGVPVSNAGGDELETKQFFAFYFVPTGVLLDVVEVSARIGYALTTLENDGAKEDLDGMSYGVGMELPLRLFGEGMPNLRLGVGGTVYQQDRESRVYGFHGGLRYDFTL